MFASNNYTGPTNSALRSKIEDILSEKTMSVKEIQNQIGGNPKSIATQLTKLNKTRKVNRVGRGVYSLS